MDNCHVMAGTPCATWRRNRNRLTVGMPPPIKPRAKHSGVEQARAACSQPPLWMKGTFDVLPALCGPQDSRLVTLVNRQGFQCGPRHS
jgi:hypothetical protein